MTAWTNDEFTRVGDAEELEISSARQDGTLGSPGQSGSSRSITDSITSPGARSTTTRLLPR